MKKIVNDTGAQCPKCGGKIIERKSKKGRVFYGCSEYPKCDFVSWDPPSKEKCPVCGKTLMQKKTKDKRLYCVTPGCTFEGKLPRAARNNTVPERKGRGRWSPVTVLGAGLAGCEAAWQLAKRGIPVTLYEMKPQKFSPAHKNQGLAELICSNSLKASRIDSAAGLLKEEMRRLGSLLVPCAEQCAVPAGGALAVDRDQFSRLVTQAIEDEPRITLRREEVTELPAGPAIVATGPLTSEPLAEKILALCGGALSFFDAAAPIVTRESLDMDHCFTASRYGREEEGSEGDYVNCPMNKEEYDRFVDALVTAERAPVHSFDARDPKVYEGCMPIEVLASRGHDAIRFGPMKPVGLRDPRTGHRPWAVLQLRTENREKTLFNLVGFQTNLKFGEQKRGVRHDPGPGPRRVRPLRGHAPQHLPQLPSAAGRRLLLPPAARAVLCRADHRGGGVYGVRGLRHPGGHQPGPAATRARAPAPAGDHHAGGPVPPRVPVQWEGLPAHGANFGVLPPLPEKIRDKRQRYMALSQRALCDLEPMLQEEPV